MGRTTRWKWLRGLQIDDVLLRTVSAAAAHDERNARALVCAVGPAKSYEQHSTKVRLCHDETTLAACCRVVTVIVVLTLLGLWPAHWRSIVAVVTVSLREMRPSMSEDRSASRNDCAVYSRLPIARGLSVTRIELRQQSVSFDKTWWRASRCYGEHDCAHAQLSSR